MKASATLVSYLGGKAVPDAAMTVDICPGTRWTTDHNGVVGGLVTKGVSLGRAMALAVSSIAGSRAGGLTDVTGRAWDAAWGALPTTRDS